VAAPPDALAGRVLAGDPRAIARAISQIEDGEHSGGAPLIGAFFRTPAAPIWWVSPACRAAARVRSWIS
jgi:hypothetical protein